MENKPNAVLNEPVAQTESRAALHETLRLYLGYLALGLVCLVVGLLAFPMRVMLPRVLSKRLGRKLIATTFRAYLRFLLLMGACRFDLSELDALRHGPALIIAPNHPSLLDAIMIVSRLPDTACIMKAEIVNSVFFGVGARLVGYIRNTPLRTMVQLAVADLRQGSHLLLFPEGTRTTRFPVGPMQGTTGLIAKYAGVPVQTVFIETNSGFLGKGWSVWRAPKMPVTYCLRLGRRFAPPQDTARFTRELDQYFQSELAHAQLPRFPASVPPA
ncbi:1-acyl-sn-glycerol-3-phosphate acyltransferase [Polaromonas sp. OV174]|uniref:lysophospholipid acyltransferase family protein n=1 Tax=Polaromonas sp. OV174 TaxID=1855300 RepID=UPI0008EEC4BF|nr:lysophospholipid acyltransferase family protein [Polaromonas sp. OV174]SFB73181.1 1-acyl-sn-glycerol-3-phosphate acyltransferase [Polaromonas sp. OV174]